MLLALLGTAELDGLGALLVSHTKSLQNIGAQQQVQPCC